MEPCVVNKNCIGVVTNNWIGSNDLLLLNAAMEDECLTKPLRCRLQALVLLADDLERIAAATKTPKQLASSVTTKVSEAEASSPR
jgi:hypothetical protein